uniref:Mitogen-activated protein kinase n=1 Tax=Chromera velia CCMP2878 TaxID=1169474 RepID=A0A0G4I2Q6_9ALVE|eukprot:Cvel_10460.t1-p1 / transcript=Cvel_10460.t1 / gene=Cvel_10460 / organism=Chromera_velia_CCMP2878 / gene_product=Mitogen-activated protein kinase 4, putative / transcript_product=Mitogen-activated protein kinase 4, putative / location=Cvel_scaffold630:27396-33072(-) / protein_length=474 / sequence_SO=supercontig / SO=protein_coding / is_pseudo=false
MSATQVDPLANWQVPERYEVRRLIGYGSSGMVAEAFDHQRQEVVAIKRVKRVFGDLGDCKRLLREVAILSRLDHPNVVRLLDIPVPKDFKKFDELYLVLEMAESDLRKLCRCSVFLSELHVKTIVFNLLSGLQYVHSKGVMHRDLKPANCLVFQDCRVKICDFGLARTLSTLPIDSSAAGEKEKRGGDATARCHCAEGPRKQTDIETEKGQPLAGSRIPRRRRLSEHVATRWYRAPELILLQADYSTAIDIWSVGCVFAELLGMIEEHKHGHHDRQPLFPGTSCFPLSPQSSTTADGVHAEDDKEQLNMIFSLLGTPKEGETGHLDKNESLIYVSMFEKREAQSLNSRFPATSPEGLDLLQKMLTFAPSKRINAGEALLHPFFSNVRKTPQRHEHTRGRRGNEVLLPFDDDAKMDEGTLRLWFLREISRFHPEVRRCQVPKKIPPQTTTKETTQSSCCFRLGADGGDMSKSVGA